MVYATQSNKSVASIGGTIEMDPTAAKLRPRTKRKSDDKKQTAKRSIKKRPSVVENQSKITDESTAVEPPNPAVTPEPPRLIISSAVEPEQINASAEPEAENLTRSGKTCCNVM